MDELPSRALRNKGLVDAGRHRPGETKAGTAAPVSAGNTGALMATARFVLKTLPHIDRPRSSRAARRQWPNLDAWIWVPTWIGEAEHLFSLP